MLSWHGNIGSIMYCVMHVMAVYCVLACGGVVAMCGMLQFTHYVSSCCLQCPAPPSPSLHSAWWLSVQTSVSAAATSQPQHTSTVDTHCTCPLFSLRRGMGYDRDNIHFILSI